MKCNPGIFHCRNDFLECYFNQDDDQYKISGVDVEEGNKVVNQIKETVKSTYNESVLNEIGGFGGCFDTKQM